MIPKLKILVIIFVPNTLKISWVLLYTGWGTVKIPSRKQYYGMLSSQVNSFYKPWRIIFSFATTPEVFISMFQIERNVFSYIFAIN